MRRSNVITTVIALTLSSPQPSAYAQAVARTVVYSAKSRLGDLMDNPAALSVLRRHIPDVMSDPEIGKGRSYSLGFIAKFDKRIKTALPAIERDLAAIR